MIVVLKKKHLPAGRAFHVPRERSSIIPSPFGIEMIMPKNPIDLLDLLPASPKMCKK